MVTNYISPRDYVPYENYSNYTFKTGLKKFILASKLIFTLFKSRAMQSNKCQAPLIPRKPEKLKKQNSFSTQFL